MAKVYADHHTIGKDTVLGEAEVDVSSRYVVKRRLTRAPCKIWQKLQNSSTNAEITVNFRDGMGLLHLRLDWSTGTSPVPKMLSTRGRTASVGSKGPDSPSRFSMMKRRDKADKAVDENM